MVANINERLLRDIWLDGEYVAFRRRVQELEFVLWIACGVCRTAQTNEEDCDEDIFPRCWACL